MSFVITTQTVEFDMSGSTSISSQSRGSLSSRTTGNTLKSGETYLEGLSGSLPSSSFRVATLILSDGRQVAPPSPHTANAVVSDAIEQALELVSLDDDENVSLEESVSDDQERKVFRRELLKDDMGLFYNELSRLKVDGSSVGVQDESFSSDEESECEDDVLLLLDFDVSASDLFEAMARRRKYTME